MTHLNFEQRKMLESMLREGDRRGKLQDIADAIGVPKQVVFHEIRRTVGCCRDWREYDAQRAQLAASHRQATSHLLIEEELRGTGCPQFYEQTTQPWFTIKGNGKKNTESGPLAKLNTGGDARPSIWGRVVERFRGKARLS